MHDRDHSRHTVVPRDSKDRKFVPGSPFASPAGFRETQQALTALPGSAPKSRERSCFGVRW